VNNRVKFIDIGIMKKKKKLAHRVCKHCGYYDGEQIIKMDEEA